MIFHNSIFEKFMYVETPLQVVMFSARKLNCDVNQSMYFVSMLSPFTSQNL